MHILDHTVENGRAEKVFSETINFVNSVRTQFSDVHFSIILGVDANVTLPKEYAGITGSHLLQPAKSHSKHMQAAVLGWLEALNVRVLNSYADALCSPEPSSLWTCGVKRRLSKRTQIDYICVSENISGEAFPFELFEHVFQKSDHRLVYSDLMMDRPITSTQCRPSTMKGWAPADSDAKEHF